MKSRDWLMIILLQLFLNQILQNYLKYEYG